MPTATTTTTSTSTTTMETFSLGLPPLSLAHSELPYPTPSSSYRHYDTPLSNQTDAALSMRVPRIWTGLWQLSSPAWGTAPAARIRREMRKHVDKGFVAFDMADHYGSAEQLFGNFRTSLPHDLSEPVLGATKWCIFKPPTASVYEPLSRQFVLDAVRERAKRMRVDAAVKNKDCARVDFLQFHWQDYADKRYLQALHILASLRHPATQLAAPASALHTSRRHAASLSSNTTVGVSASTSPSSVSTLTGSLLQHKDENTTTGNGSTSATTTGGLSISTKIDCYPSPSSSYDSSPSSSYGGALSPAKLAMLEQEAAEKLTVHQQQQQQSVFVDEGVRIGGIGLVNFDSVRVDEICASLGPGVILTNQVQFSLIDVRPLYGMAEVCKRHGVKLLTYGTLCGGFLSDKWLDAPEPNRYFDEPTLRDPLTPSQKKYLDIILSAWGTWPLFQRLLRTLRTIGDAHNNASIANVATRWVLDHDEFVGAVIIGARLGVSDNTDDNLSVFGWRLSEADHRMIQDVLRASNGKELIRTIGDCGAEYR